MFSGFYPRTGTVQPQGTASEVSQSVSSQSIYKALCDGGCASTQPWNISIPAQAAGIAALGEVEYVERARKLIFAESEYLSEELYKLGMTVFPSQANYLFFKGPEDLFEICVGQNVLIRDCSNYPGLGKGFYRVAVRTHEENERLIQAIHDGLMEARKKTQEEEGEE